MSFHRWMSLFQRASLVGSAAVLAAGLASAQSMTSESQPPSASSSWSNYSSSAQVAEVSASADTSGTSLTLAHPASAQRQSPSTMPAWKHYSSSAEIAEISAPSGLGAMPSAPASAASAAGQMGQSEGGGGGWKGALFHHYALELGGGFNAPTGDTVDKPAPGTRYITWGGQFVIGYGKHITKNLAMLLEYQFIDDKIPGAIIAETGAQGGHAHIWSFTLDPVWDLFPSSSNDLYVTGGGGFYRKKTNFTTPAPSQFCSFYYCGIGYTNQVVGSFSSNQGGFNIGGGYLHRFGGMYGPGKMGIFVEARYLDVLSPAITTQPNGLGTTSVGAGTRLIPVTIGLRW